MVALPPRAEDPTLRAVDAVLEARAARLPARGYLGMSSLARPCARALWYGWRWAAREQPTAAQIRRFEDGHRGEALMAERLRAVEGVQLLSQQDELSDLGGHLRGHLDGIVHGLLQAPKTPHVWEHKAVNEDKHRRLRKAIEEHGEKGALAAWDPVYFGQAQLYLHYTGLKRHYLTCSTPGERETVSVRTDYDPAAAEPLVARARTIIEAADPPPRLSEKPEHWECKPCAYAGICHHGEIPQVSCRTCAHASAERHGDGLWSCALYARAEIPEPYQRTGCERHLFLPSLLPWPAVDASAEHNWIEYAPPGAPRFRNGDQHLASRVLAEHGVEAARGPFAAPGGAS